MASIQARHGRTCALGKAWTTFEAAAPGGGCTCRPTYWVTIRDGAKVHREKAGKNRKAAEAQLRKVGVDVDDGSYEPLQSIRFREWGTRWLKSLERKETTRDGYTSTVDHAAHVFGDKLVRRIAPADIAALNVYLRDDKKLSDSSRAKHLRVLHACLGSAVKHRYAKRNPVEELPNAERPRPVKTEAPYFEDDELVRLFARFPEFVAIDVPNVYRPLFLTALKTGMRQGELLELRWGDVDLTGSVVHVRRSITDGHISTPKNRRKREVHLTGDVVEMLGNWWGMTGRPADEQLVFPGSTGNHLWPMTILRRILYPAMAATEVGRREGRGDPAQIGTGSTDVPFVPAHVREARARERLPDHLAVTTPRPFQPRGHERGVRTLGRQGEARASGADGGRLRGLASD